MKRQEFDKKTRLSAYREALEAGASPRSKSKNLRWIDDLLRSTVSNDCIEWPFSKRGSGYGQIVWKYKRTTSHRVICELAHGAPTTPEHQAAHSCGNRSCCNPRHLSWKTPIDNIHDKIEHGTQLMGDDIHCSKLKSRDVSAIKKMIGNGARLKGIATAYGVSIATISDIKCSRTWRHIGGP
jgi:hypothetical protein